ncbi:hypothetical protein NKJ40_06650 [Mesorhizobium sp. M0119]|uniref:hypothetical protein n=1 Tax=Mesorhizobium sp. M0119 TaxID=2956885 RepID=UPI003336D2B0
MSAQKNQKVDKGGAAEEALREYFKSLGSFVLRGIPVREAGEDVTDVDLWVYTRTSAHARHVSIVDIKNKKRGKAFERAIWVKGLQSALRADEAIIASQGAKDSVYAFSSRLNVRVISSSVFDAIVKRYAGEDQRLSNEEVDELWRMIAVGSANLKVQMDSVKVEISRGISFPALNHWVDEAANLLKLGVERERKPGPITRAAYMCSALVGIGADYLGKEHSLSEVSMRREYFRQGLLFGRTDAAASKSYVQFAENVVTEFFDPSGATAARIRAGFETAVEKMPVQGLVEFFAKPNVGTELLKGAIGLEAACFSRTVPHPSELGSLEAKTIIGLVSDYAGLRRKDVLGASATERQSKPDGVDTAPSQRGLLL